MSRCAYRITRAVSPHAFGSALQSLPEQWVLRGKAGHAKSCSTRCRGAAASFVVSDSSAAEGRPGITQLSDGKDVLRREAWEAG